MWIYGSNLWPVLAVKFGGASLVSYHDYHRAGDFGVVPTNAFNGPITVVARGGLATTPGSFRVTPIGAPIIQSFSPAVGKPGDRITVRGLNFTNVTAVQFNGLPGAFTELAGNIHMVVPTNATSGPITVATQHGTTRSADSFTVLDPGKLAPVISDFFPKIGPPGTAVTLRGINARSTSVRSTQRLSSMFAFDLGATVPTNATSGPITVEAASSRPRAFTVLRSKPEIAGFRPKRRWHPELEFWPQPIKGQFRASTDGGLFDFLFAWASAHVTNATSGPISDDWRRGHQRTRIYSAAKR